MKNKKISVIGLGKLGSPMVASFAAKGFNVIGVDTNLDSIHLINKGMAPVFEPQLNEYLHANHKRISATDNYNTAIANSEISFIIVPTPSDKEGAFSLKYVLEVGKHIGGALRKKSDFHLVVLTSTVLPGATEKELLPVLEFHSGKRCGRDFGICYNPEFVALGSVIKDIFKPNFILIGESDPDSGEILTSFYKTICENNPPIARMNFVNAELTKISVNTYVTTKISYANMLAEICEHLPGANIDIVTSALGLDPRIGPKYLKGALGYGGPCFPRDNIAFAYLAHRLGTTAMLAETTNLLNKRQVPRLLKLIKSKLSPKGKVGILGLAYKPNTDVVEESEGIGLARSLIAEEIPVMAYDPAAMKNAKKVLNASIIFTSSLKECIQQVDIVVITVPWKEFKNIQPEQLARPNNKPLIVIDCWRILDHKRYKEVVDYVPIGIGS